VRRHVPHRRGLGWFDRLPSHQARGFRTEPTRAPHGVYRGEPGIDRPEDRLGPGEKPYSQKAPPQIRRGSHGYETGEIVVQGRVAIAEHPAHRVAAVEDVFAASRPLHLRDRGGYVEQRVAVDVPAVVEVGREGFALRAL